MQGLQASFLRKISHSIPWISQVFMNEFGFCKMQLNKKLDHDDLKNLLHCFSSTLPNLEKTWNFLNPMITFYFKFENIHKTRNSWLCEEKKSSTKAWYQTLFSFSSNSAIIFTLVTLLQNSAMTDKVLNYSFLCFLSACLTEKDHPQNKPDLQFQELKQFWSDEKLKVVPFQQGSPNSHASQVARGHRQKKVVSFAQRKNSWNLQLPTRSKTKDEKDTEVWKLTSYWLQNKEEKKLQNKNERQK